MERFVRGQTIVEMMALGAAEGHPSHIYHQLFIIYFSLKISFSV